MACGTVHRAVSADAVLDHLLGHREVISYRAAYDIAFGPLFGPWRGYVSARKVVVWARATRWREVAGLEIGLHALLCKDLAQRPARRRERENRYGKGQSEWAARFGEWTLCRHKPHQAVGLTPDGHAIPTDIAPTEWETGN